MDTLTESDAFSTCLSHLKIPIHKDVRYELIRIDGKIKIFLRIYTGCAPAVTVRVDDEGGIHNTYHRGGISMISCIILRIDNRNIMPFYPFVH